MEMSRADVKRCRDTLDQKIYACEQTKQSYGDGLETANKAQRAHYQEHIPRLLDDMRKLDVARIDETRAAMQQNVDTERGVLNVIQRCYNDMREAIDKICPQQDTHIVVEQKKTGYPHPADFAFQDLGAFCFFFVV